MHHGSFRRAFAWTVLAATPFSCAHAQSVDLANLQTLVSGLSSPVGVYFSPGEDSAILYILQQGGLIKRSVVNYALTPPTAVTTTFLDLTALPITTGGERGLLGLAFHPEHAAVGDPNFGLFYVYYNAPLLPGMTGNSRTVIARCRRDPLNPAAGTFVTEVMTWARPGANHNGGCLQFGPDGMLYISSGEGGSSSLAQDSRSLMGKLLRIDVTLGVGDDPATFTYRVPPDNPVIPIPVGSTGTPAPEVWAWGLRNPWRFSFDRRNGDLYIADVGSGAWEEVDFSLGNKAPGINWGWPRYEGNAAGSGTLPMPPQYAPPVYVYPHTANAEYPTAFTGSAITGGFVYTGRSIAGWRGRYVFADYVTRRVWSLRMMNGGAADVQSHTAQLTISGGLTSLGQDHQGELYLCMGSVVSKFVPQLPQPSPADVWDSRGFPGPDGFVTGADFDAFIEFYFGGHDLADIATEGNSNLGAGPDGFVTGIDFDAYVIFYFSAG